MDSVLDIKRPEFMYISGSYVLNKLLNNPNWSSNDLDLYICINDNEFNYTSAMNYFNNLFESDYLEINIDNQNIINELKRSLKGISTRILDAMELNYFNKRNNTSNHNNLSDTQYYNHNHNILDVYSIILYTNDLKIDVIMINNDIESYIIDNFDLSIVKNYIDHNGLITQIDNYNDINNMISDYNFNLIQKSYIAYQNPTQVFKFIQRVIKYSSRGFKIYMKYNSTSICECPETNCLCSIYLDKDFINFFNQGVINYNNVVMFGNHNFVLCSLFKNHTGKCCPAFNEFISDSESDVESISDSEMDLDVDNNESTPFLCNKSIKQDFLIINTYDSEIQLKELYNNLNFTIVSSIFNKYLLIREIKLNAFKPENLLLNFPDLLD
jgi:hypothetical protein